MLKNKVFYCISFLMLVVNNCPAQAPKGMATYLLKTELGFINAELDFKDSSSLFIFGRTGMDTGAITRSSMNINGDMMKNGMSVFIAPYDSTGNLVYRNFKTKEIITRTVKLAPMDAYTVTDNWLPINWTIEPVFDTISGYVCQKATGFFRGRYYTAWFAPGIPVPYGPWKLFGLPGLIIFAYDRDNVVYAALKSLCYPCDSLKTSVKKPYEPKNMTIKEEAYFYDHYAQEVEKKARQISLPKGVTFGNFKNTRTTEEDRDHAFEKTYEWEKQPQSSINIPKN